MIPVRHDLDEWLAVDLGGDGLTEASKDSVLFRATQTRGRSLTDRPQSPQAVERTLK